MKVAGPRFVVRIDALAGAGDRRLSRGVRPAHGCFASRSPWLPRQITGALTDMPDPFAFMLTSPAEGAGVVHTNPMFTHRQRRPSPLKALPKQCLPVEDVHSHDPRSNIRRIRKTRAREVILRIVRILLLPSAPKSDTRAFDIGRGDTGGIDAAPPVKPPLVHHPPASWPVNAIDIAADTRYN